MDEDHDGEPITIRLSGNQCTVHTAYPPHENPNYKVKVYAPGIKPWDVPRAAHLPLVYFFPLMLDDTFHIDVYDGTGESVVAYATYCRTAEGLALKELGPPRQQWAAPGRIEETDDVSDAAAWFRVLIADEHPDVSLESVITPAPSAALAWPDALAAARKRGHRLEDAGRSAAGQYRIVRCRACGGTIMARTEHEAGGRITHQPCVPHDNRGALLAQLRMPDNPSQHVALDHAAADLSDSPQPSQVTDVYWLYTDRQVGTYPETTERAGKWMVFVPRTRVDAVWATLKRATEDGRLGSSAKVSTARPNPNAKNPDEHVICVYTYDEADDADVQRIRSELRSLGITWKIPYKLDNVTLAGRYQVRGDRHISSRYE
ncbi:MAG TPA: putative phosphothreonine lyase domain-containing protein [Chloroflexota bacterium]|nr:putative phosphothreonine lyase domain-containing protein [Chloroflexota bacterium]